MSTAFLAALLVASGDPTTVQGEVRLTRAVGSPLVSIVTESGGVELVGELAQEVGRLQSGKVEVVGTIEDNGKRLRVSLYRILDVGGAKPLVGYLIEAAAGLALKDGEGSPLPLSIEPRVKEKLQALVGAKIWVAGKKLVSGELKVQRYGVLREPPKSETRAPDNNP